MTFCSCWTGAALLEMVRLCKEPAVFMFLCVERQDLKELVSVHASRHQCWFLV